ncbi:hypothetical protein [Gallaecimonas mangrovi]|uniref:hypothetical protein n=1 Tax=Gallaecimonas mangrovi TaxID=2291597 RepID=UPI000E1FC530|nr:hypothetical protein [Gallaecimonas mangrovi]
MPILPLISYFFGGAFVANALPHWLSGLMGMAFQSPFAKPAGEGLSSSTVNVLWGLFNLLVAYFLLARVGHFSLTSGADVLAAFIGMVVASLVSARHFGRFHGGRAPSSHE